MSANITIARPYAKAFFSYALETNKIDAYSRVLDQLADVSAQKRVQKLFTNPHVSKQQWLKLFKTFSGDSLDKESENFLELLAGRNRLKILPDIEKLYRKYVDDYKKRIEVKVVSAFPIDNDRLGKLQKALQKHFNRDIEIRSEVDRSILGGAIIYAGDHMIDGSLRGKVKRLSENLC